VREHARERAEWERQSRMLMWYAITVTMVLIMVNVALCL
jgi:hypothetical protein